MSFQLRDKDIIWSCNERERETEREKWGIEVEGGVDINFLSLFQPYTIYNNIWERG